MTVAVIILALVTLQRLGELVLARSNTRRLLDSGHAKGKAIKLDTALHGIAIPLHPGAEKFYKEKGLIK